MVAKRDPASMVILMRRKRQIIGLCAAALVLLGAAAPEPPSRPSPEPKASPVLALTGVTLIDGTGAPAVPDAVVVSSQWRTATFSWVRNTSTISQTRGRLIPR